MCFSFEVEEKIVSVQIAPFFMAEIVHTTLLNKIKSRDILPKK